MPPRRRPGDGLHRMDAAFSALCPMGFTKTLVRKTVNSLLKVYGGNDGWSFIEETSYKLVIDTILEEEEKTEAKNSETVEASTSEVDSMGQSNTPNIQSYQDEPPCNQILPADSSELSFKFQLEKSPEEVYEEVQSQHTNSDAQIDIVPCPTQDSLKGKAAAEKRTRLILPDVEYPPRCHQCSRPAADLRSSKKRKPCYGWISWEDEEEAAAYLSQAP